jgi:phage virion morphogenesis protein
MLRTEVQITPGRVQERLNQLIQSGRDTLPLMQDLGRAAKTQVQLGFRSGQAPDGSRWAPLRFRSGQPLRDTGRLRNSIDYRASRDEVIVGTNVCYAIVHQFGATIRANPARRGQRSLCGYIHKGSPFLIFRASGGRVIRAREVTIPARPFFPEGHLPPRWERALLAVIAEHFSPR